MSLGLCLGGVTREGTMISNLPLLFADGYPTCLDKISVGQLEKFVPFMIQCSSGHDISQKLTTPKWWPVDLQFAIPLVKPPVLESKWLMILKSLVCRCYTYHGCEFMLRFCTDLSKCPTTELTFVNSWDGTTSLYNQVTGKLLVTFRNENMCYDTRKESSRKKLLPKNDDEEEMNRQIMVQPQFDIYLCDGCDGEFSTLQEVQEHEKTCSAEQGGPSNYQAVAEDTEQDNFLNYFDLITTRQAEEISDAQAVEPPRYKRGVGNSLRFTGIPLSSPLGILVHKKARPSVISSGVQLERMERFCSAKADANTRMREPRCSPWPVSWKPRQNEDGEELDEWVHVYKNPKRQWRRRAPFMLDELSLKMENLLKLCQSAEVRIRKLTEREIMYYTQRKNRGSNNSGFPSTSGEVQHKSPEVASEARTPDVSSMCDELDCSSVTQELSQFLSKEREENITEDTDVSFDQELPPNTLYVYGSNIAREMQCIDQNIPVIDLVSSDEEGEINNTELQSCKNNGTAYDNNIIDFGKGISTESGYGSHLDINCSRKVISNFPPDYNSSISSYTKYNENHEEHCTFLENLMLKNSQFGNDQHDIPRATCDKSVQCSFDDFEACCIPMDYEEKEEEENVQTTQYQAKLPDTYPQRET